jgi:hypothetical protein
VTWRKDGYVPAGIAHPGDAREEPSIGKDGEWLIPRIDAT